MAKNNPGFELFDITKKVESYKIQTRNRRWGRISRNELDTKFPILIDTEISRICNLKCPFCYRTMLMAQDDKRGVMSFETFKSIFKSGFSSGVKLNWLGESLMNKEFPKMVKYLHDNNVAEIMLNTNGVFLTPKMSRQLIESGITRIIVSVDSIIPKTYEKLRVGAKFDQVIQNLKDLVALRGNNTYPIIRVQKIRLPELEVENNNYINFFKRIGVDHIAFNSYKEKNSNNVHFRTESCQQPFLRVLVDIHGDLHPCCGDAGSNYVIGNIKEMTIREAWNSQKMKAIRHLSRSKQLYKLPCCSICDANK